MSDRAIGSRAAGGARVLVVEDEKIIAKDIEQTLQKLGHTVVALADNGAEAVRKAADEQPDLVLMDIRIRGPMDGIDAAAQIRSAQDVPVVFLTAFADAPTLQRARDVAPYGYVLKPFDDRELHIAVMLALLKHEAFRQLDQRVRERTEELLKSETRFRQMAAVAELGLFALARHDLQAVLERAVGVVCTMLGTDTCSVFELTSDGSALVLRASCGLPEGFLQGATVPGDTGSHSGYTLLRSEPVISEDYASEQRFRPLPELRQAGVVGAMTVVIHGHGERRPYGVLGTGVRTPRPFLSGDAAFLQAVANVIATTVARLRSEEQRASAERLVEEQRIQAAETTRALALRDEFLSIASHELRTPLTSLQLQLQALAHRTAQLDERLKRNAERAIKSSFRLGELVERLLDVSRLTTGKLSLHAEPMDLKETADEVADRLAENASQAGCELKTVHASGAVRGSWDRLRIEQVLVNLLSNAFRYGPGAPVAIRTRLDGDQAELRVTDRGPGIAPGDAERIFDRFGRAAPARHYGGLGLGLYVSRKIVEAHGGTIALETAPGAGSTFIVRLPLVAPAGP